MPSRKKWARIVNKELAGRKACAKRWAHFKMRDEEIRQMVSLSKTGFIGEVPVIDRLGGPRDGEVVGTAQVERTRSGDLIVHIDASQNLEFLTEGFRLGDLSIREG